MNKCCTDCNFIEKCSLCNCHSPQQPLEKEWIDKFDKGDFILWDEAAAREAEKNKIHTELVDWQKLQSFIKSLLSEQKESLLATFVDAGEESLEKVRTQTIEEENKEWREGRRCEICGEAKSPNQTTMCDDCLENS